MTASRRKNLLRELFATASTHLRVSYLRISLGASDLNFQVFTCDDICVDQTNSNPNQLQFRSLAHARTDLILLLKEILAINPGIKFLDSPWRRHSGLRITKAPEATACGPIFTPSTPSILSNTGAWQRTFSLMLLRYRMSF